jgi:hypothetical protein
LAKFDSRWRQRFLRLHGGSKRPDIPTDKLHPYHQRFQPIAITDSCPVGHAEAFSHACSCADRNTAADSHTQTNCYPIACPHSNTDSCPDRHAEALGHACSCSNRNTGADSHTEALRYPDPNSNSCSNSQPVADSLTHTWKYHGNLRIPSGHGGLLGDQ